MHVLVTGAAGFIGSHVVEHLLQRGDVVRGLDNFDPFYARERKEQNLRRLLAQPNFEFVEGDILEPAVVRNQLNGVDRVLHLAALAGVRPSLQQPSRYMRVNVEGTLNVLEACRDANISRIVLASSSSVYGARSTVPFREDDPCDTPQSPYAASKRAMEIACWTHHELYQLGITCLRYFTVYGPRQRPEMAIHKFVRHAVEGRPIPAFGDGGSGRDYTYIDDIVAGTVAALDRQDDGYRVYNLGGTQPVTLKQLLAEISDAVGQKLNIDWQPNQPGDVPLTCADIHAAQTDLGYQVRVPLSEGLRRFVDWFRSDQEAAEPGAVPRAGTRTSSRAV